MKRISFEADDSFAENFFKYCEENNMTKKSAIMNLIKKELNKKCMMEQYAYIVSNENYMGFINEENYKRLSKIKIKDNENWEWKKDLPDFEKVYYSVNERINYYFEEDSTLASLIEFSKLSKIEDLSIPHELLDHYHYMKFNNKDMKYDFDHLYGIMTFPYMDFERLSEIISSWNTKFWNLFIINPALMKYVEGSLGLFITPINSDISISEYNGVFKTLTGYNLFYLWTNEKKIEPIRQNKKIEDISKWFESLTDAEFPKMYKKIVRFWFDNKEKIECYALENSYFQFTHKMPHEYPPLIVLTLEGDDFEMFDTKSGWSTGKCNKLGFDLETFNCIYVNDEEIVFTKEMLQDFKDGTFELKII